MDAKLLGHYLEDRFVVKSRTRERERRFGQARRLKVRTLGRVPGEIAARFPLPTVIEARMLFRIKAIRRDLRKLPGSTEFLILLNSNELPRRGGEGGARIIFSYVRSRKVLENK